MENQHWKDLQNLVIVACHAVYLGNNDDRSRADDSNWALFSYQTGEPRFFVEHIHCGVEITHKDSKALLVFTGGQTRPQAGPISEAVGYWMLAGDCNWWEMTDVKSRATTEEFARDSFENLFFPVCRFNECTGRYPQRITLVSWKFKEKRFDLHREAIRFPKENYRFIGPNNPEDLATAERAEQQTIEAFRINPYAAPQQGSEGEGFLADKRESRNPFNRQHGYVQSCPELAGLLQHRETDCYDGLLPWI